MENQPVFVGSLWWRDCDPILTVVGCDRERVEKELDRLAAEELEEAVDQEAVNAQADIDSEDEANIRANLEGELMTGGVFAESLDSLGLEAENLRELETDGLTVY